MYVCASLCAQAWVFTLYTCVFDCTNVALVLKEKKGKNQNKMHAEI